jgi:hypothetical protein
MNSKTCCTVATVLAALGLIGTTGCSSGTNNSLANIPPVMAIVPYIPGETISTTTTTTATPPPPSQSHAVNGTFGTPLVALVTSNGSPASGVVVTFQAPTSGASGSFADKGGTTTTATSNANGLATAPAFTANGTVGTYSVMASITAAPTPATFTMINTTGAPATVTATAGNNQSVGINSPFATALTVKVVDSGNNPVSNAIVVFTAPATGASGTFTNPSGTNVSSTAVATNASGVAASTTFTANGIAGADTVIASVAGVVTNASFSLTNLAGPPQFVTAISGTPQSMIGGKVFTSPLSVMVTDSQQNPISGATVTFTAPTTGASGTFFANGASSNSTNVTTNASGVATTTAPFTANSTAGTYSVTAAVSSGSPVNFTLTNWPVGSLFYSYYLSGQEVASGGFYALAGSVVVDPAGDVLAGEQDYNDGLFITSPQPTGDATTGGSLKVNSTTHLGSLVIDTNNLNLGVNQSGVLTFALQFVNPNHALIIQYDGTATSSGSLDVQSLPSPALKGGYAFTLSGTDPTFMAVGYGGVFSISDNGTTLQNGFVDTNDAETDAASTLDVPFSGTLSTPDTFGRGTITSTLNYGAAYSYTGSASPIALNYYIVGPEVIRIIDVDTTDSAIGSAFGQGTNATTASNASLGTSIFGIEGNFYNEYGAAGMFSTNSSAATFSGVADDDELFYGVLVPDATIGGTYSISSNGYGSFTVSLGDLGDVNTLGIYMTDPNLNLLDPNNTNTSETGGGLLLDLDTLLASGVGLVIPQTDTSAASFTGSYAFGAQDQYDFVEFDFLGSGSVTSGAFSGLGGLSDPFMSLGEAKPTNPADFATTPLPDPSNAGRYTMLSTNSTPNPLAITIAGNATDFDVVMYQANADQLFWLDEDFTSVFLGSFQQLGSFPSSPAESQGLRQRLR